MASFQVKIGQKRMRKRENKYYRSVPFRSYPKRNRKLQRKQKKSKNYHKSIWRHFQPKQVGQG